MAKKNETVDIKKVTLKTKTRATEGKEAQEKKREFPVKQAVALLSARKKAWELADENFEWNGEDIVPKSKS